MRNIYRIITRDKDAHIIDIREFPAAPKGSRLLRLIHEAIEEAETKEVTITLIGPEHDYFENDVDDIHVATT